MKSNVSRSALLGLTNSNLRRTLFASALISVVGLQWSHAQLSPDSVLAYDDFNDTGTPGAAHAPAVGDATLNGIASQTDDAGGFSGEAGDRALDLHNHNDGSFAQTAFAPMSGASTYPNL